MSENKKEKREMPRKLGRKIKRENKTVDSAIERKAKRKISFYAKASEIRTTLFLNQLMIVLMYKEAFSNINQLGASLSSSIVSLLQEYDDVFPKRFHMVYHLFEGLSIKLISCLVLPFQTD